MNYVSFFHAQSVEETLRFLFLFFLNTGDLVKGTPCQLNSISECVESCWYIHHTDILSNDDDYALEAMETQNSVYRQNRLSVSQY